MNPSPAPLYQYEYNGFIVEAYTLSEARARLKEALRISQRGRLPVGAFVKRLQEIENESGHQSV